MPTQRIANRRRRLQCHAPKHKLCMDGRNGTRNTLFKTLGAHAKSCAITPRLLRDYSAILCVAKNRAVRDYSAITPRLLRGFAYQKNQVGLRHALPPGPTREWARVALASQNTMEFGNIPF